jgi:TM2 domain-containing membrane protein YozV
MKKYWLSVGDGQTYGPYTVEELRAFSAQGRITANSFVCEEGAQEWVRAGVVMSGPAQAAAPEPVPDAPQRAVPPSPVPQSPVPPGPAAQATFAPPIPAAYSPAPPLPAPQYPAAQYPDSKSKIAAGLLGILLGSLGIHNFYLGFIGKGIAQLLLTVLTCGWLAPVTWIWGLIEGIMILTGAISRDGRGVPLRD